MDYEPKSPIKDVKDLKVRKDYAPGPVPDEGKTVYTGDTNWNAVQRGYPPHEHDMDDMGMKKGKMPMEKK